MSEHRIATLSTIARRLGVTADWLRAELEARRLPGVRAGRTWLCDPTLIEAALLDRARQPPGDGEAGGGR